MSDTTLFIGNKRYSSWSLRGWLACRLAGLDFQEVTIPLDTPGTQAGIRAISPSGRVPCLHHDGRAIWDSLAIAEYCAEMKRGLWPEDPAARAQARTIACEMHSGFVELRKAMFFNIGRRLPGQGRTPAALQDIARIEEIWAGTRSRFAGTGPFLFGDGFTLADAFYAPIACRFVTWAPELSPSSRAYVDAVWNHPLVAEWVEGGLSEPWRSAKYEEPAA